MTLFEEIDNMGSYADAYIDFFHVSSVKQFIKDLKSDKVEDLAKFMHDVYESYAKANGWKTQENCRVEFKDLPEKNKYCKIGVW